MTFIYPLALALFILIIYTSSITSLVPLSLAYLLYLYSLKDLPKGKHKTFIITISIIGFILSFLNIDLLLLHNSIILINLFILVFTLDKNELFIQIPSFIISILVYLGYFLISSHNYYAWFACLIVICICLYPIYNHLTFYLSEKKTSFMHHKYKPISSKILIPTLIISIISSLFFYQEYHFKHNQQYFDSIYYTLDTNEEGFSLTYPIHYYVDNYHGYESNQTFGSFLNLPKQYYQYRAFRLYLNDTQGELYFEKRYNAPETIEEDSFNLYTYYQLTGWNSEDPKVFFDDGEEYNVEIYPDYEQYYSPEKLTTLSFSKHKSFHEGRSLLSKVYTAYDGTVSTTFTLDFSVYLSSKIMQTTTYQYTITEVSKETGQRTILENNHNYFSRYDALYTELYANNPNGFDFENNKYEISYQLFNKYDDLLFSDSVVIE